MRIVYDWTIGYPGRVLADVLVFALAVLPLAAAIAAGGALYHLLTQPTESLRKRWYPGLIAWIVGCYVLVVGAAALLELPKAIARFLND